MDAVRLVSPFPESEVPRVWRWTREFARAVMDDFAPPDLDSLIRDWERRQMFRKSWAVYRHDELVGVITLDLATPYVGLLGCAFSRFHWTDDVTVPALKEACSQALASGLQKIAMFPFAHSQQIVALAKKAGFRKEGVLRSAATQDGQPVDLVALGMVQERKASVKTAEAAPVLAAQGA